MSIQSLRVWLVDDDASIRWVLERAFRNGGMSPRAFEAAEPALDALRRESPELIITDIRMPGQSGLELLKKIREVPEYYCSMRLHQLKVEYDAEQDRLLMLVATRVPTAISPLAIDPTRCPATACSSSRCRVASNPLETTTVAWALS